MNVGIFQESQIYLLYVTNSFWNDSWKPSSSDLSSTVDGYFGYFGLDFEFCAQLGLGLGLRLFTVKTLFFTCLSIKLFVIKTV